MFTPLLFGLSYREVVALRRAYIVERPDVGVARYALDVAILTAAVAELGARDALEWARFAGTLAD